jgi:hypothetical protein
MNKNKQTNKHTKKKHKNPKEIWENLTKIIIIAWVQLRSNNKFPSFFVIFFFQKKKTNKKKNPKNTRDHAAWAIALARPKGAGG